MKTIIIPTDFSDNSFHAAFYAAAMAMDIDADLILLHMLPSPFVVSEVPLPPENHTGTIQEANQSLRILKERLQKYSNDKLCISTLATEENFFDQIDTYAKTKELFAVVMSTTSMGATDIFFWGSFTIEAAKNLKYPLIIIPSEGKYRSIEKIGLACDMMNVRDYLPVQGMKKILEIFKAKLDVLFVSKTFQKLHAEVISESKFVQNTLAQYHPSIKILSYDNVKDGLEGFVHKNKIDLLLLLPKRRNFLESIFHKSLTRQMIIAPSIPIMIIHT